MIDLVPATGRTAALIASISDGQLDDPTPCPQYTLGDLLDHVNGLSEAFTAAARKDIPEGGTQGGSGDASRLEANWRILIPERLAALGEAWRDAGAWVGQTQAGGVDLPAEIAGMVALNEVIVHGWDIAKASGQPYDADPEHPEVCIQVMGPQPGEVRPEGQDVPFARPIAVPSDASALDRLVGELGRDPAWASTAR